MPCLNLITGTTANYFFFQEKILQHYKSGNPDSYIYLLPVNRAARYFKQHLYSKVEEKGIADPQVFTFNSLIQKIFKEIFPSTKIINKTIRVLLLQDILNSTKSELNFTNNNVELSRSLVRKIDLVINELKEFGYEANSKNKNEL